MILSKDIYEYLLNFVEDTDVINMLSVNKKFCNEELFERVMRKRYPLLIRFKKNGWRKFYIIMNFYIEKLKEKDIPYIPLLDFNPEIIYKSWQDAYYKVDIEMAIDGVYKDYPTTKDYHTIGYKNKNNRYEIQNKLCKGTSMSFSGVPLGNINEIMIDFSEGYRIISTESELWLSFEAVNDEDIDSALYDNKNVAIRNLYEKYTLVINKFIHEMIENEFVDNREDALQYSNLNSDWADFSIFSHSLESKTYPLVLLYQGIPTMSSERHDFALIPAILDV